MKRSYFVLLGLIGCVDQGHKRTLEQHLEVMVETGKAESESTKPQEVLRKIEPTQIWTGTNGPQYEGSFEVYRDTVSFVECWRKNFQRNRNDVIPACPSVDFETNMVV